MPGSENFFNPRLNDVGTNIDVPAIEVGKTYSLDILIAGKNPTFSVIQDPFAPKISHDHGLGYSISITVPGQPEAITVPVNDHVELLENTIAKIVLDHLKPYIKN